MNEYTSLSQITYYSSRYNKRVTVPKGYMSDGATGAIDIKDSTSWWVHDWLCDVGRFDDGTECTNWQASAILSDILVEEGHRIRSVTWRWTTFLFGGKKLRWL